jgi:hypothetical protein
MKAMEKRLDGATASWGEQVSHFLVWMTGWNPNKPPGSAGLLGKVRAGRGKRGRVSRFHLSQALRRPAKATLTFGLPDTSQGAFGALWASLPHPEPLAGKGMAGRLAKGWPKAGRVNLHWL